jgi:hypothetical protein
MRNLFQSADRQGPWHPREDDLLLYIDGELSARRLARIGTHLKACWACRVKVEKLESTITAFMDYRSRASARLGGSTADDAFRLRLRALARQERSRQSMRKLVARARRLVGGANVRVSAITAAVVMAVALMVLAWKYFAPVPVSAGELLANVTLAESARANDASVVQHRSLFLEKRRSGAATPIERRRIDVWHAGNSGVTVRRLYDESGRLLAAEWRRRDGSAEILSPQMRPRLEPRTESSLAMIDRPEDLWRLDPSAASFVQLAGDASGAKVSRQGENLRVSLGPELSAGHFLRAVLTIHRNGLRATGIDLRLAEPVGPAQAGAPTQAAVYDYSIAEDSYQQEPMEAAQADVFALDAALLPPEQSQVPVATPDLQVETIWLLDRIGATLGGEITVSMGSDGRLHLQGIVQNEMRKQEILTALKPVRSNPAVQIDILSYSQALHRTVTSVHSTSAGTSGVSGSNSNLSAQADIGEFLASQSPPPPESELRERVMRFSAEISANSNNAARHAWVLKHLAEMASSSNDENLSAVARRQYLSMVAMHARQVEQSTRRLKLELDPIFFAGLPPPGESPPPPPELSSAVDRLLDGALLNDKAIQSAFGISMGAESPVSIRTAEFRESVLETEELACWIEKQAGGECLEPEQNTKASP